MLVTASPRASFSPAQGEGVAKRRMRGCPSPGLRPPSPRFAGRGALGFLAALLVAMPLYAREPIFTDQIPFVISGTGTPGASVTITVESKGSATGVVAPDGTWAVTWTTPLPTATYTITTTIGSEKKGPMPIPVKTRIEMVSTMPVAGVMSVIRKAPTLMSSAATMPTKR